MMYHSHGTPVDVVPTTAGIPSTLNPLSRYYREFLSHSCGNTTDIAVLPQIPLPCSSLPRTPLGSLQHSPRPPSWWALTAPKNLTPAVGLGLRPFGLKLPAPW